MANSPRAGFRNASTIESAADERAKGRVRPASFADHYSQARQFFRSQSPAEQAHIASALVFELSKVETLHVRAAVVGQLRRVDESLGKRVAEGLGLTTLPPAAHTLVAAEDRAPSPALQLIAKMKQTLEGRAVGILIAEGTDAALVATLRTAARDAGASVKIVAPKVAGVKLDDGTLCPADGQLAGTPSVVFDAVAVLLSAAAAKTLAQDSAAIDFVRDAFGHLKAIAVDGGGRALLQAAGIVADAGVLDAQDSAKFIAAAKTRQWAREPALRSLA